jgi:hypothetical protein
VRKIPTLSVLAPLLAAAFLAGCGPVYYPGDHPDQRYPDGAPGRYGDQAGALQGTVESVDPGEHLLYIAREGEDRGDRERIALAYDDGTVVRYQGRTFRPEALERGDRIQVSVDRDDDGRLLAESIDVLYDVSQGGPPPPRAHRDDRRDDRDDRDDDRTGDLRGTIRSIDTRSHTLRITDSDRDETVVVGYDDHTTVRYQGRLYTPENLERGDEVRIRTHDYDGQPFAQEIVVVADQGGLGG